LFHCCSIFHYAVDSVKVTLIISVCYVVKEYTPCLKEISIYYVHKVDAQGRDSTFAPSPQTYSTAAFREGQVHEGANLLWLRCQVTAANRVSEPAVSR